jgi:hypothetical protein
MRRWPFESWLMRWAALVVVWCTATAGAAHPYDEPNQAAVIELGEIYNGSNEGATGEALSHCGYNDTCDVWHQLTVPNDGLLRIEIASHTFDTVLSVFDPCNMAELACCNRTCVFGPPQIQLPAAAGTRLLVRVAGYARATGGYELLVSRMTSEALSCVLKPSPADGAEPVPINSGLRWDGLPAEVVQTLDKPVATASKSGIRMATIYGSDDRRDEYEVQEASILSAGRAVAMLTTPDNLIDNGDGTLTLFSGSLAEAYVLRARHLLCPEERFRDQPAPGLATGFLVAPQILATVGHVVSCADTYPLDDVVVFDFAMPDGNAPSLIIRPEQLYTMQKVLAYNDGIPDWALVQLDRPVTGRTPLHLRRQGRLVDDVNDLWVIGHPLGLPRKYSGGGKVLANANPAYFETDLDVNIGNSGSPILREANLQVEGILFSGNEDFVANPAYGGRCDCSLICPDEAGRCDGWEWITRATCFSPLIPTYDLYLAPDPNALTEVASNLNVPWFTPARLLTSTTYHWQIRAHTIEGIVLSPIWSFKTSDSQK